jgi:hypothetical protein
MKDNNLSREEITERYNNRVSIINYFKYTGTIGGGTYSLVSLGSRDFREILAALFIAGLSYSAGNYLYKKTDNKKQKALKNIEKTVLSN